MAARKTKGLKLEHLIGNMVKVQLNYKDVPEGPYKVLGWDSEFFCFEIAGEEVWVYSKIIEAVRYVEAPTDAE